MSGLSFRARTMLAGLLLFALAACTATQTSITETQTASITMKEFAFEPAKITVKAGQPVKLTLVNDGALLHDFTSMDAAVEMMAGEHGAQHDMNETMEGAMMHIAVDVGKSATLEFTPTQAGVYTFFCTVEGHRAAGMEGQLIVTP